MISRVALETRTPIPPAPANTRTGASPGASFADTLKNVMEPASSVRISAHAAQRLEARGIRLSSEELTQVGDALDQLARKGGNEALVVLEDVTLVASVPNRTIITAVASGDGETSVFTNIDSAAVIATGEKADTTHQSESRMDATLNSGNRPDPLREAWVARNDRRAAMSQGV